MTTPNLYELSGVITAKDDLLLRERGRDDNVLASRPGIAGSSIRGHLASRWIAAGRPVDEDFRTLFLSGTVRFHHAHPTTWGGPSVPAPLSLMACKTERVPHADQVRDLIGRTGLSGCEHADHNDDVGGGPGSLKRVKGFVGVSESRGRHLDPADVIVVRQRIGTMADGSGLADPGDATTRGKLFTETLVRAGTQMWGRITGPAAQQLDQLAELLGSPPWMLSVGRARTIYGRISWSPTRQPVTGPTTEDDPVTLLAVTDWILTDDHLRPLDRLDAHIIATAVLGCDPAAVDVIDIKQRAGAAGGYDVLHQMARPADPTIVAGTTIRLRAPAAALRDAVVHGVGWRRAEGYGEVTCDSPVHTIHDAGGWQLTARPTTTRASGDIERQAIAERAHTTAGKLHDTGLTPTLWRGLEVVYRAGSAPVRRDAPASRSTHAQSRSGAGAGAGDAKRTLRNQAIDTIDREADGKSDAWRARFAADVGEELELLWSTKDRRG